MRIHDTAFRWKVVNNFFYEQCLEELISFVVDFTEAIMQVGVFEEEVFEYFFRVIIFAGTD